MKKCLERGEYKKSPRVEWSVFIQIEWRNLSFIFREPRKSQAPEKKWVLSELEWRLGCRSWCLILMVLEPLRGAEFSMLAWRWCWVPKGGLGGADGADASQEGVFATIWGRDTPSWTNTMVMARDRKRHPWDIHGRGGIRWQLCGHQDKWINKL